jgi:hypothetical protein
MDVDLIIASLCDISKFVNTSKLKVQDLPPIVRETALVRLPSESSLSTAVDAFVSCLHEQAIQLGLEILPKREADTQIFPAPLTYRQLSI